MDAPKPYPVIRDIGLTAMLVSFAGDLSEAANRAALAYRVALEALGLEGVAETSTSLASVFVRFDPFVISHADLTDHLQGLIAGRDWYAAPLPGGRTLWRIPVVIGGDHGPEFEEAAELAGLSPDQARSEIADSRVRVLTLGFAPGQPYMGQLPEHWNIPRMTKLNPQVPGASLVVAIRQLIIFGGPAPTGWRHIGQTAFRCFRPDMSQPFALTPGDEVTFRAISSEELVDIAADNGDGDGGATREVLE